MIAEILHVSGLHAYYGESHILHGVDFSVQRGEVVTLLGAMGPDAPPLSRPCSAWSANARVGKDQRP
jgi:ABC-type histidine transport system ATPase subunit